jgi:putative ATP-binding cassette transporter
MNGYNNASTIFPTLVASPRYFAGMIQLGDLMQISSVFASVQGSLSFLINSYPQIASWRASANRLTSFTDSIKHLHQSSPSIPSAICLEPIQRKDIEIQNLALALPDGSLLLKNLNFTFKRHESVLISGPSGAGKSTFLRALAGIWSYGQGTIRIPTQDKIFFLPQKPYLPLGTLSHAIYYPQKEESEQSEVNQYLGKCSLAHLIALKEQTQDWSRVLSLGEQQRIAFIRILLQKPDWVFLDESSCSLDEKHEEELYQLLKQELPSTTVISVGHRSSLEALHQRIIEFPPQAGAPPKPVG